MRSGRIPSDVKKSTFDAVGFAAIRTVSADPEPTSRTSRNVSPARTAGTNGRFMKLLPLVSPAFA